MKKILSIISITICQSKRNKIFVFMMLIMLGLITMLPSMITSDGTLKGKTVILMEYSLMFSSFFLFLGAIWLSLCAVREEYIKKTFMTLFTKPVSKATLLLGKFLGVYIFTGSIFVLCCGILLGNMFFITHKATEDELKIIKSEVLCGRSVLALNEENTEIKPGTQKEFLFDLSSQYISGSDVFIRFRFYLSNVESTSQMHPYVTGDWMLKGTDYNIKRKFHNNNFNEIVIPGKYVKDGKLELIYSNVSANPLVFFSDNIEVMAQTDSFYISFAKVFLLKFMILGLFVAFGSFISSYMSFVPAAFVGFSFYFISNSVSFLKSILEKAVILGGDACPHCHVAHDTHTEPGVFDNILRFIIEGVVHIFPDIDNLDKVDLLIEAKAISYTDIKLCATVIAIYTVVFLIVGMIILTFKGDYLAKD